MVKDEYTLVLVKPDGVKTRHIGEIITRIERKGYKIEALKMIQPTEELLRQHYADKVDKPFFPELLEYMTEGPIVGIVVSGTNVIKAIHNMAGATNPVEAEWGTIRGDYGREWPDGVNGQMATFVTLSTLPTNLLQLLKKSRSGSQNLNLHRARV